MTRFFRLTCVLFLALVAFARAELKLPKQKSFSGAEAQEEIDVLMTKGWGHQVCTRHR